MKKILYPVIGLAVAVFALTGCQKEVRTATDGDTVEAAFTIDLGTLTKAYSDGTSATTLNVLVYGLQSDGTTYKYLPGISLTGTTAIANAFDASLKATVKIRLVKGVNYDVVFWAQNPDGPYTLNPESGTMTVTATGDANLEKRDAFYALVSTGVVDASNTSFSAQLRRPFAQINVFTTDDDWKAAVANEIAFSGSSMNVIKAPGVMNLRDGSVSGEVEYAFAAAAVNTDDAYAVASTYKYIAMNYVLAAAESANTEVKFEVFRDDLTNKLTDYDISNVPYRRNWRTNIVGNIFSVDGEFTIEIVPAYDGETVFPIDGDPQTVTVPATGFAPASAENYAFDAATNTGSLTLAQGSTLDFSGITTNSGFPPTYSSSNTAVGTITNAGVFTAVSPGTTNVTIHFNSVQNDVQGTKAEGGPNLASADVVFTVTVPEPPVAVTLESIAVKAPAKEVYEIGEAIDLTGMTVTATYSDESTKDVTAQATTDAPTAFTTAGSVTVTVSYTEGEVTKTASFSVTVNDAEVPAVITATVAEFLAAEVSTTQKYQLTGIISNVVNTYHGNFNLVDETGTVYVYGLEPAEVAYGTTNTQTFSTLGLKAGDKLTLIGYRGLYGSTPEVVYPYYVSHVTAVLAPTFSCEGDVESGTLVTITSETEGATIYYTLDGTEPTENSTVYSDPVSITEAITIKAIAVKEGMITSSVATASYTIKIEGQTIETLDFSKLGYENGTQYTETTQNELTVTFGDGTNDGKYYNTGSGMRIYGGGHVTITAGETNLISKIVFAWDGSNAPTSSDVADSGTYDVETLTWTGSATSVTLTRPSGSGHWRLQKVTVTYKAAE